MKLILLGCAVQTEVKDDVEYILVGFNLTTDAPGGKRYGATRNIPMVDAELYNKPYEEICYKVLLDMAKLMYRFRKVLPESADNEDDITEQMRDLAIEGLTAFFSNGEWWSKKLHDVHDIKAYLNAIDNCKQDEDEDSFFRFNEDDFLGDFAYKVQRYDRYNYTNEDYNNVNHLADLLTDFVQTGFLNVKADSFRREDVERIKWGKKRAEVVLKNGKTIATCNQSEYWFIGRVFGTNHSTFSYTHLDKKEGDNDED